MDRKPTATSSDGGFEKRRALRAALALFLPLVALVVQAALWRFIAPFAWFLFFPAIFASSWIGGMRPGLIAAVLATFLGWWFFVSPEHVLIKGPAPLLPAAVFLGMGVIFAFFHERLRKSRQQGEAALAASRHANERLQQVLVERRIFSALIDNSSDFIGLADPNGKPIYVNPAGRRMVGLAPDYPIENTQIPEYYPPRLHSFVSDVIVKAMREKGRWQGETYFRNWQTQAAIPVSDEHFMIRDPETERVLGMGTVTRNIADIQHARDELDAAHRELQQVNGALKRMYQKAKDLDEVKTRLFANVSHELRTPLTLILAPTRRMLDAQETPDEVRRDLEVIDRNAHTLLRHVNDLLDVAKLEAAGMQAEYVETDFTRLVRFVASHFEVLAQERQISYALEIPEGLHAQLDADKLHRVLLNLLSNAFKFTPDGGRVRLSVRAAQGRLLIEVADSGAGIPADKRDEIFERFRQLEGGTKRRFGGTGLGLSIARDLVGLHQGSLVVAEAPEGGALFLVDLPQTAPAGRTVRELAEEETPGAEQARQMVEELRGKSSAASVPRRAVDARLTAREQDQDMDGSPRVLVVEDNAEMNRFICENLGSSYRLSTAFDGREGLQKALQLEPDLVLSDMMMPELSGEELVHAIRSHRALDRTAIVLLTAKADDELRVRLLRAGVQDYLMKPFLVEELRSRVDNLIAAKHAGELEARLASLVSQAPDGIFVADIEGRYMEVNNAGCRMLGYDREQIIGKTIIDLIPPDQVARLGEDKERLLRGEAAVGEWVLRRADGSWLPVEVSAKILPDGRWQGFVRDISERKAAAEAISTSEAKFRQIVSIAEDAIVSIDDEHRITLFNEGAERIFGWTAEEVLHQPLDLLLPERFRAGHREHVRAFAASGVRARPMNARLPVPALRRNGEEFPAQASISHLVEGGRHVFTSVFRDVSQEVRILEKEKFLSEIGAVLASSLDVEVTLDELSHRAVRYLGDLCIVDVVKDGNQQLRVASRDPGRAWVADALQRLALDRTRPYLGAGIWQTQQPLLVDDVGPYLEANTQSSEHLALLRATEPRSMLAVPMLARGRLLGVLTLLSAGRSYDRHDLLLALEVASRAAMAIDNASLHDALLRANEDIRARLRELQEAQEQIRTLTGLLPVCAWCGRVRDEGAGGSWKKLDQYVAEHSSAQVSHGICPDCRGSQFGPRVG